MPFESTEPVPVNATVISVAREEAELILWLRDRDAHCPLCGYNLRALPSARCPECGNELRLSVSLTDPYLRAWITLGVVVCGSAGLGFLFLCLVLRAGLPGGGDAVKAAIRFFIATTPTPLILLKFRRRFQRLSRGVQWIVTSLVALFPAAAMAVLCANLR